MNQTGKKCALCGIIFDENDDVVVCPECGAPHHRDCWKQTGHCAREEFHGTEEVFDEPDGEEIPEQSENDMFFGDEAEEIPENDEQRAAREVIDNINNNSMENISINGISADIYEAAIGKNQRYYIPRFMLTEKAEKVKMWNFMAFLTPMAWAFYRKLYKLAAIFLAFYLLLGAISVLPYATNEEFNNAVKECVEEDPNFLMNMTNYFNDQSGSKLTQKQQKLMETAEKLMPPQWFDITVYAGMFILRIVFGFFGTKIYFNNLTKKIRNADSSVMPREVFKGYLYKKCGTAPIWIAVIIGFFEFRYL